MDTIQRVIKRRAMQVMFGVGVVLAILTLALAVRGRWATDWWCVTLNRHASVTEALDQFRVVTGCNAFAFEWRRFAASLPIDVRSGPRDPPIRFEHVVDSPQAFGVYWGNGNSVWIRLGFSYASKHAQIGGVYQGTDTEISIPSWFALLICATMTALPGRILWRDRWRRSRIARGLCPACAYDLRGANHERCPECGEAVSMSAPV